MASADGLSLLMPGALPAKPSCICRVAFYLAALSACRMRGAHKVLRFALWDRRKAGWLIM